MILKLSKEALAGLPAPDSQGMVRVTAAIELTSDGKADLVEINDTPVGSGNDDDDPMPSEDVPDLDAAMNDIYQA